jgi:DNA-binding PadR family transcriptional regulator
MTGIVEEDWATSFTPRIMSILYVVSDSPLAVKPSSIHYTMKEESDEYSEYPSRPTTYRAIELAEEAGYVEAAPGNRYRLTEKGKELVEERILEREKARA